MRLRFRPLALPPAARFSLPSLVPLLVLLLLGTAQCAPPGNGLDNGPDDGPDQANLAAPVHALRILRALPHDPEAFTEGLFVHGGRLYESTGHYGESDLRVVDIESGRVLRRKALPDELFGEGTARLGASALQLTWKARLGIIYDLESLERVKTFRYQGEGWGLASGPDAKGRTALVMSDGSDELAFLDSATLAAARRLPVRDGDKPVKRLNELEWYHGLVLANVWLSDLVAAIDPQTGTVTAWIDLSPLRARLSEDSEAANGIAFDAETDKLYVTGKNWDKLFEVEIDPPLPGR